MQKISINDINALYHWQHNRQIITWTKNNEVFTLDCPIDMQLEDMIDIIKNMTVEDK